MKSGKRIRKLVFLSLLVSGVAFSAEERAWIEVSSPNFTVISNDSEKTARKTVHRFEQFRNAMKTVFPKYNTDTGAPLFIFAARNADTLKSLYCGREKTDDAVLPGGVYRSGINKDYMIVRTDIDVNQAYPILYKGYVYRILGLNIKSIPHWLEIGLSEFFGEASISGKDVFIGNPNKTYLQLLTKSTMLPWEELFAIKENSEYSGDLSKTGMVFAQSWGLVHYLQLADNKAHAGKLSKFLGMVKAGTPDVEAAQLVFGDFVKLEHTIRDYAYSNMDRLRVPLKLDLKPGQYVCRTLGKPDSLAVRGDLLAVFRHLEDSEGMLKEALAQDPKNVLGNEGMGILFLRRGDDEQARKYFTAAAELGSGNFLAHYYAAQTALKESRDLDKAKVCLEKALTLNPAFEGTKKLLGVVYESQKMKEQEESAQ